MNEDSISIPQSAARFILFQRTAYIRWSESIAARIVRKVAPPLSYNRMINVEARLRNAQIRSLYAEDISGEFSRIRSHLPNSCSRILDIGCGVAGIDVFLSRYYNNDVDIYLLDKSTVSDRVYYLYEERGAFYNSLGVAKELLISNGIDKSRVTTLEATPSSDIDIDAPLDLVISLISWGFHYPVATYLDRVHALLRVGGRLILDVRKGQGGEKLIGERFGQYEVLSRSPKSIRICATK